MTIKEYKEKVNPCYGCGCWNPDMGCEMPSLDMSYACPLKQGDNKAIDFFMLMIPPTHTYQERQVKMINGKPAFYDPPEVKAARKKLLAYLGKHVPEQEFKGPVRLTTWWCFPVKGKHYDGEYRISRPDTDNLVKMLKDVMTELHFWKDDAQVVSEVIEKYWADIPGIYVKVESL